MEITTVPSSAVHTEPVDELQKELTESPKNDVKGDSSKILDSNLRCAMLLDRMEASPLKDLDDEVLASPYTSIRRAQKDYGISSPRSNRKVASPGRFPGTTHWSASNVDSPYVGYRFAPKLPALAMLPQKTNNYKRYWLLIPVVGVVMAMTVAGAISLWHLGKFKCSTSELQRCRNFGATSCINRDDGTECLCTNKLKIGPCEPPSCRDVAQEKCFNRICVEPVRCVFAREYIEALSREDRAVDVSCTEVLSEICASSGVIPFCANSNTYPFGHICNPDPIRPLRCDTSESEYLAQAITRHDRSTGKTNLTEYCYRKRRIYSCLVGLIDYDVPHNASVINCGNWCSKWEGDGCSCTLQAKQAKVKTRSTYNKKSRKGITVSQHCAPKSFPQYCDQPPEVLDQISEAWFKIENDVATDHFYSNIEDLESFIKRVKSIEPDYIDDYVKIYMKAGKDIKIENKTCLPLVLTLGGLYLTSTSFGRNVLKEIYNISRWNRPRLSTRLTIPGDVEYWFFTNHQTVFKANDPCRWDSRAFHQRGFQPDFFATAQLLYFVGSEDRKNVTHPVDIDGVSWASLNLAEKAGYRYLVCLTIKADSMECERILFWRFRSTYILNKKESKFLENIYGTSPVKDVHEIVTVEDEFYWVSRLLRIYSLNNSTVSLRPGDIPPLPVTETTTTTHFETSTATERNGKGTETNLNNKTVGIRYSDRSNLRQHSRTKTGLVPVTESSIAYTERSRTTFTDSMETKMPALNDGIINTKLSTTSLPKFGEAWRHFDPKEKNPMNREYSHDGGIRKKLQAYICNCVLGLAC